MKNVTVSFRVSDQNANALKNFISEYKTFPEHKQKFVLGIIKKSLFEWDSTEVIPDERIRKLMEITRLEYLILGLEREVNNFKFKIEGK
ncbi:MAG: hypothetical protein K2J11_12075 [Oscillospiraceae bacterium]|nr:hypothetical protein [Oscillospiraceae bacterium]